jgi:hypothetical protein
MDLLTQKIVKRQAQESESSTDFDAGCMDESMLSAIFSKHMVLCMPVKNRRSVLEVRVWRSQDSRQGLKGYPEAWLKVHQWAPSGVLVSTLIV